MTILYKGPQTRGVCPPFCVHWSLIHIFLQVCVLYTIDSLKYHTLGILKGDQLDAVVLKLSEMFAKGSTRVSHLITIIERHNNP